MQTCAFGQTGPQAAQGIPESTFASASRALDSGRASSTGRASADPTRRVVGGSGSTRPQAARAMSRPRDKLKRLAGGIRLTSYGQFRRASGHTSSRGTRLHKARPDGPGTARCQVAGRAARALASPVLFVSYCIPKTCAHSTWSAARGPTAVATRGPWDVSGIHDVRPGCRPPRLQVEPGLGSHGLRASCSPPDAYASYPPKSARVIARPSTCRPGTSRPTPPPTTYP
jgi:hypothetical protein